jgi:hypothetical protein
MAFPQLVDLENKEFTHFFDNSIKQGELELQVVANDLIK